jgi:hypothetical protein
MARKISEQAPPKKLRLGVLRHRGRLLLVEPFLGRGGVGGGVGGLAHAVRGLTHGVGGLAHGAGGLADAPLAHLPLSHIPLSPPAALASVSVLRIRRAISCSCPLLSGVIFGSRDAVCADELYAPSVRRFEGIDDDEPFRVDGSRLLERTALPRVLHRHRLAEATVVEFERDESKKGGLFPIAWFRFDAVGATAATSAGELCCALKQRRALRVIILKMCR